MVWLVLSYAAPLLMLPYLIWAASCLASNYNKARKIGLPILIAPIDSMNPLWMLTKDFLIPIISRLPYGLGEWASRGEIGWTFYARFAIHAKYGEAFIIVSPGHNEVILAEPAATDDIMRRRNDFIKDPAMYGMLDFYGPNLDTVNGKVWDRHRKITVPPFNEQNSALVWGEAAEQADYLKEAWTQKDQVTTTQYDVHAVALNVLCGAGFGMPSSFLDVKSMANSDEAQARLGYRESLRLLLANIVQLVFLNLLQNAGIPRWMLWGGMQKIGRAYDEFKEYMGEMIQKEKTAFEQGDLARHNLMSALVRASEQSREAAKTSEDPATASFAGLTDDEVYGNLFIYNLAGHDTTAATLQFAITVLAVFPQWQEWIAEEIDRVRKADPSGLWYYEETFPLLERCLALMYETARLYGPVVMMPRFTGEAVQRLVIGKREHLLPPQTTVTINFAALHTHPDYWGTDALIFRPDRWIVASGKEKGEGQLHQPPAGAYVPWNAGPRVCPGKKFSQVEFVCVIFSLFAQGSRVEVVREPGETAEVARSRVLDQVNRAKVEVTLKIVNSEQIKLRWFQKS